MEGFLGDTSTFEEAVLRATWLQEDDGEVTYVLLFSDGTWDLQDYPQVEEGMVYLAIPPLPGGIGAVGASGALGACAEKLRRMLHWRLGA
jgi:hypothetical protein